MRFNLVRTVLRYILPIVLLIGAFAAGLALGNSRCLDSGWSRHNRQDFPKRMLTKLTKALELSEPQQSELEEILREKKVRFKDLRKELRPRFKELHEQTRTRINKILNDEQKVKFELLRKRFMHRHHKEGHRHRDKHHLDRDI